MKMVDDLVTILLALAVSGLVLLLTIGAWAIGFITILRLVIGV